MLATTLRATVALALLSLLPAAPATAAGPVNLQISESGSGGQFAFPAAPTGLPCMPQDAIRFDTTEQLTQGEFSNLTTDLQISLDFLADGSAASLLPEDSRVRISNARGVAVLQLVAGSCDNPTISSDGTTFSGTGTWSVNPEATTGAYREMTGSGTFTFGASSAGSRPWFFQMDGQVAVLQPSVTATVVDATWGGQRDPDARGRTATVTYRVSNEGPGDAFDVSILEPDAAAGIELLGFQPIAIAALPAGEFIEFTLRWSIGKSPDGGSAVRGNEFDTAIHMPHADALDVGIAGDQIVHVVVPTHA